MLIRAHVKSRQRAKKWVVSLHQGVVGCRVVQQPRGRARFRSAAAVATHHCRPWLAQLRASKVTPGRVDGRPHGAPTRSHAAQLRKGIRAVGHGKAIDVPRRYAANPVPTYNLELVTRVPLVPGQDDNALVRRFGHQVAEIIIDSAELPPGQRQESARARVRALIAGEFS